MIPDIPPHLGRTFFVSPSNISLINLSIEHSVLVKPSKIGLIFTNPKIQQIINIKLIIDTIIKNGILQFGALQHLQQLHLQKAQQQNITHPGIHKKPKTKNIIAEER